MIDFELTIERDTIEVGRTFSAESIEFAGSEFKRWVAAQLLTVWNDTNVPPTRLVVRASIEAQ